MNRNQLVPSVLLGIGGFVFGMTLASPISVNIAMAQETPPPVTAPAPLIDETPQTNASTSEKELSTPQLEAAPPAHSDEAEAEAEAEVAAEESFVTPETQEIVVPDVAPAPTVETDADEPDANSTEPVELSVRPGTTPVLPADRPAWVDAKEDLTGEIHRLYVSSAAVSDPDQLDLGLEVALAAAFDEYILHHLSTEDMEPTSAYDLGLDGKTLLRQFVSDPEGYVMELDTDPPMYKKYVAVEITPAQRHKLQKQQREVIQRSRLAPLAAGLVGLLGLAGLFHLVLKRKNVLPASQPLEAEHLVANPAVAAVSPHPAGKKRSGFLGLLLFLMVLGGIAMLVVLPLVLFRATSVDREIKIRNTMMELEKQVHDQVKAIEAHKLPLAPTPPNIPTLHSSENPVEWKLESGGQTIIIRDK